MKVKQSSSFDDTLDAIMKMDEDDREMLLEIVKKRQIELRRNELAKTARKAEKEFREGKLKPMDASELIEKLKKNSKKIVA